jgi:preprotein translocase subunit SecG
MKKVLTFNLLIFSAMLLMSAASVFPKEEGSDIVIRSFKGTLRKMNLNGGFIINYVSENAELKANGTIKIGRVEGNLSAITSVGDIQINEVSGNITAITQAGNISIEKAHQHVYAQAELGEIIIQSANSVEIQNIFGGDVKLFNISGWSKVITKGNILLVLNKQISSLELCNLSSIEGDITLYLPENLAADIEIRTPLSEDPKRETHIKSDFSFIEFKQRCEQGRILNLSTSINNGGGKINIYIEKGNVYIKAIKS